MRYFRHDVLAVFINRPEKYSIQVDEFEGSVRIRDSCSAKYGEDSSEMAYLNVSFGFRACRNGEWAVAAYAPDLSKGSPDEQQFWTGFEITSEDEFADVQGDIRFQKWWSRYILGDWSVEEGPIATLDRVVKQINAITECVVWVPMFTATDLRRLCFPSSENTHRYEDAHAELYRLIVDGLDKDVITAVGKKLGITVTAGNKRTLDALEMLFPQEPARAAVRTPLDVVSEQRRRASHKERSPAQSFPAFEEFEKNLRAIISSVSIVRDDLAERLNVNIERCEARAAAMKQLPVFDETRPTQPNYGIFAARNMVGKNVTHVRTGELVSEPETSEMEAIVVEFSDGSMMSIEPITNISQVIRDNAPIDPQALYVTFYVNYVPPLLPFTR
jgi:hypothetical protein